VAKPIQRAGDRVAGLVRVGEEGVAARVVTVLPAERAGCLLPPHASRGQL